MKKGIALAMETIVYLILAVLVLAILLYFLTSQAGPAQNQAELLQKSAQLCSDYIKADSTCSNINGVKILAGKTVSDLLDKCRKLNTAGCSLGGNDQECVQRCCSTYGCIAPPLPR